jgi:hypothetical protein
MDPGPDSRKSKRLVNIFHLVIALSLEHLHNFIRMSDHLDLQTVHWWSYTLGPFNWCSYFFFGGGGSTPNTSSASSPSQSPFSNYSFIVHHLVHRDDSHLLLSGLWLLSRLAVSCPEQLFFRCGSGSTPIFSTGISDRYSSRRFC